jgi:hypothetical protein
MNKWFALSIGVALLGLVGLGITLLVYDPVATTTSYIGPEGPAFVTNRWGALIAGGVMAVSAVSAVALSFWRKR